MSYFHGRQGHGARRTRKEILRAEATHRNTLTPDHRRKAFLLGPVTPEGVRTSRSIAAYADRFKAEHGDLPGVVRARIEQS